MAEQAAEILTTACGMELMRVETADGKLLGHVFDLRCRWRAVEDDAPRLEEIIIGPRGWFERIGLRRTKPSSVHWYRVESMRGNVIVVAANRR
jgi:hypothetical protein